MRSREKDRSRIILGIDPGSIVCGYGIIKTVQSQESRVKTPNSKLQTLNSNTDTVYVASGRIMLPSKQPLNVRLRELYSNLTDIIREYSPYEVAIEKVFFAKSIKAALVLGQARGAALVAAASSGLSVYEYSALEVKKAIAGYGRAEKHQVQSMVSKILSLKTKLSADSADALALALCHLNTMKILK
ncbi:MAG: crossover junction endodeoxyribonuclease RuvC [Thermodesulfovibrionales bacterium]|nr:crossover junction endodeoxyribonuclease RuvC [Thermodesulfovibrionales bacterium]